MLEIRYPIERACVREAFASINAHVTADAAYLPVRLEASGCCDALPAFQVDDPHAIEENDRAADSDVELFNTSYRTEELERPGCHVEHVRHGASERAAREVMACTP